MKYIRPAWRIGRLPRIFRGKDGAVRQPLLYGIPLLLASALVLFSAADSNRALESDTDGDGMSDVYELFFGLNPADPADAYLDYDGDHFSNLRESAQLTDPLAPDTDRDGFNDDVDASPISRAYIRWGAPHFTTGDQYDYAHPDWFLRAYKTGGEWVVMPDETATNTPAAYKSAWYMSATSPPGGGSLSIDLDRAILTNNLRYAVHYLDTSNSSLYVDLLDTNGVVLVENLYGNLMTGSNVAGSNVAMETIVILEIPTALFPEAAVIHLRCGEPGDLPSDLSGDLSSVVSTKEEALAKTDLSSDLSSVASAKEEASAKEDVIVYKGLVYIDEDGDGLDADGECLFGTSDYSVDTDGDGVSDYDEVFIYHTDPCKPDNDNDHDGDEDKDKKGIIYVDQAVGDDRHTGRASLPTSQRVGTGKDGPKKTIHKGMAAVDADSAHTLIIKSGVYNENLDLRGKNVKVVIEGNVRL